VSGDLDVLETFEHANRTIKIVRDPEPPSPLEYDNYTKILCRRDLTVDLGDVQSSDALLNREDVVDRLAELGEHVAAILPVYGVELQRGLWSVSTEERSNARRRIGWAYVTAELAVEMGSGQESVETFERYIREDVKTYDDYLSGDCYGYLVEGRDGDVLESCWGFYGDLEYVRSEARAAAENVDDPTIERAAEELAGRATYAGPVSP